jgi:hypothetical protein
MKKLFLTAVLACAFLPAASLAQNDQGQNNDDQGENRGKRHVRATELTGIGVGATSLVGALTYLALRKRGARRK